MMMIKAPSLTVSKTVLHLEIGFLGGRGALPWALSALVSGRLQALVLAAGRGDREGGPSLHSPLGGCGFQGQAPGCWGAKSWIHNSCAQSTWDPGMRNIPFLQSFSACRSQQEGLALVLEPHLGLRRRGQGLQVPWGEALPSWKALTRVRELMRSSLSDGWII